MITSIGARDDKINEFLGALRTENDRGAALTAAAFAETLLDGILKSFLADKPETHELTNGFAAPLGTFAAKIKLVYVLGLIDDELQSSLDAIRRLRNKWAHEWMPVSFDSDNVDKLVDAMPLNPLLDELPKPNSVRARFDQRVAVLLLELTMIPDVIRHHQRSPSRLIHFGRLHATREQAEAEFDDYKRTDLPPWDAVSPV